tara:strand:- start:3120 stop:3266 length:147 start_codon:yes stop_codon:yes gene_type:complete
LGAEAGAGAAALGAAGLGAGVGATALGASASGDEIPINSPNFDMVFNL